MNFNFANYPQVEHCVRCNKETIHVKDQCVECIERQRKEEDARWAAMAVDEKLDWLRNKLTT